MTSLQMIPVIEIIIGGGIVSMLWKMNCQLAALSEQLKTFAKRTEDHEVRIRDLERGN